MGEPVSAADSGMSVDEAVALLLDIPEGTPAVLVEEAAHDVAAELNRLRAIAPLLRVAAAARREYASPVYPDSSTHRDLLAEGATLDAAARIAAGDYGPLYDLLPSWRWTLGMERRVLADASSDTTFEDVAGLLDGEGSA